MNRRRTQINNSITKRANTIMKWRRQAQSRADISFFIFIVFFAVFGIIVLTELLFLERSKPSGLRLHFNDEIQGWELKADVTSSGEPPPPALRPLDGVWQPVRGTNFRFYVYSAYVERRTTVAVRVIAATKTRGADRVFCRLWLPNNYTFVVKAVVQTIRENWNLKFSAVYVLCSLNGSGIKPKETAGGMVAVIAEDAETEPPSNLIIIQDTDPKPGIDYTLHVCVKPFHFKYDREDWLVEWIELNILLGVSHFYMYNNTIGNKTSCILDTYRQEGLVTLLPWKLPIVSKAEIRTEGQFAAFNDCLYRSMSKAGWLLVIDVDEVVFPRRERTLVDLIYSMQSAFKPPAHPPSSYLFRNAFFYIGWKDDPEAPAPLLTARKTRRWATPHTVKNRSKFVVKPFHAVELGNHFLWEHAPGKTSIGVRPERALLHHYRENCEYGGKLCLKVSSVVDRTAHNWTLDLVKNIDIKQEVLRTTCSVS